MGERVVIERDRYGNAVVVSGTTTGTHYRTGTGEIRERPSRSSAGAVRRSGETTSQAAERRVEELRQAPLTFREKAAIKRAQERVSTARVTDKDHAGKVRVSKTVRVPTTGRVFTVSADAAPSEAVVSYYTERARREAAPSLETASYSSTKTTQPVIVSKDVETPIGTVRVSKEARREGPPANLVLLQRLKREDITQQLERRGLANAGAKFYPGTTQISEISGVPTTPEAVALISTPVSGGKPTSATTTTTGPSPLLSKEQERLLRAVERAEYRRERAGRVVNAIVKGTTGPTPAPGSFDLLVGPRVALRLAFGLPITAYAGLETSAILARYGYLETQQTDKQKVRSAKLYAGDISKGAREFITALSPVQTEMIKEGTRTNYPVTTGYQPDVVKVKFRQAGIEAAIELYITGKLLGSGAAKLPATAKGDFYLRYVEREAAKNPIPTKIVTGYSREVLPTTLQLTPTEIKVGGRYYSQIKPEVIQADYTTILPGKSRTTFASTDAARPYGGSIDLAGTYRARRTIPLRGGRTVDVLSEITKTGKRTRRVFETTRTQDARLLRTVKDRVKLQQPEYLVTEPVVMAESTIKSVRGKDLYVEETAEIARRVGVGTGEPRLFKSTPRLGFVELGVKRDLLTAETKPNLPATFVEGKITPNSDIVFPKQSSSVTDIAESIRGRGPFALKPQKIEYVGTYFEFVKGQPKPTAEGVEIASAFETTSEGLPSFDIINQFPEAGLQRQLAVTNQRYKQFTPAQARVVQESRQASVATTFPYNQPSIFERGLEKFTDNYRKFIFGGTPELAVITAPIELGRSVMTELRKPAPIGRAMPEIGSVEAYSRSKPAMERPSTRELSRTRARTSPVSEPSLRDRGLQQASPQSISRLVERGRATETQRNVSVNVDKSIERSINTQVNVSRSISRNVQSQKNVQEQTQVQRQLQQQLQRSASTSREAQAQTRAGIPDETTIIIPPPPSGGYPGAARNVPGYDVLVRQRGRKVKGKFRPGTFAKVNEKPLTRTGALGLGSQVTDETVARSFKLQQTKQVAQSNAYAAQAPRLAKFRRSKRGDSFVERSRHAIDSPGEFRGITVKGWLASKRAGRKKRGARR